MILETILKYMWLSIAVLAVVFTITKLILIKIFKLKNGLITSFFSSLRYASIYEVQRANSSKRKRYLNISNWVNIVFYATGIGVCLLYALFRYIIIK